MLGVKPLLDYPNFGAHVTWIGAGTRGRNALYQKTRHEIGWPT